MDDGFYFNVISSTTIFLTTKKYFNEFYWRNEKCSKQYLSVSTNTLSWYRCCIRVTSLWFKFTLNFWSDSKRFYSVISFYQFILEKKITYVSTYVVWSLNHQRINMNTIRSCSKYWSCSFNFRFSMEHHLTMKFYAIIYF